MKQEDTSFHGEPTSPYDICDGSPANGLVWGLESFGSLCPPTEDNFYTRNGREFLRSSSWERKGSREKDRPKRWHTTLYEDVEYTESEEGEHDVDLLDLHEKLEGLRDLSERRARVVELRFFGGLTFEESAHVLGIAPKTA